MSSSRVSIEGLIDRQIYRLFDLKQNTTVALEILLRITVDEPVFATLDPRFLSRNRHRRGVYYKPLLESKLVGIRSKRFSAFSRTPSCCLSPPIRVQHATLRASQHPKAGRHQFSQLHRRAATTCSCTRYHKDTRFLDFSRFFQLLIQVRFWVQSLSFPGSKPVCSPELRKPVRCENWFTHPVW